METGPQNVLMGDNNFDTDLPETEIDELELVAEKHAARFSRTREFKILKEFLESRIAFYQDFLPDGRIVADTMPTSEDWRVANRVIGEFKAVIRAYEDAREVVKNG